MLKHNTYYEFFASMTVPNPDQVGYWIDLGANSKGKVIKVYNSNIKQWVKLTDVTSEDAVSPYIGSNGNWYVDNRDTGISATGKNPYIGNNSHWFVYDGTNKKYIDTGIYAKGLSAYEIALRNGFVGTERDWLQFLRKPALDAAEEAEYAVDLVNKALVRVDQAVEDADLALSKAQESVDLAKDALNKADAYIEHPMKIIDDFWYAYDFENEGYYNTNIRATGKSFKIMKVYDSVASMLNDYNTGDVEVGEFVWINTGNVEDPDDSKLYLKTDTEWQLVGDLSGNRGIQGESAYEIAVQNGFVGTEEEWLDYLRQPSLDAADQALQAKAQVEATEASVKEAEALRVSAENTRVSNESSREEAENFRVSSENIRITNDNNRSTSENIRVKNEKDRIAAENERNANEQIRKNNELAREESEDIRVSQETTRQNNESIREENENARKLSEEYRIQNEQSRVNAESERNTVFNDTINVLNISKNNADAATTAANTAATNANTQANRAKQYADNPPIVGNDGYWYVYSETEGNYVKTDWHSNGIVIIDKFNSLDELTSAIKNPSVSDTYLIGSNLYLWNGTEWVNLGSLKGTKGDKGETGNSGVYVGSGDMPVDCNVQIDPTGEVITQEELSQTIQRSIENEANIDSLINNLDKLGNATALSLDVYSLPKICGCELIFISNVAPNRSPDFIGQIYIDTSAGKVYMATNVNSSADYKVLN